MNTLFYPPSPADVDTRKLLPSLSFRKQVSKVIIAVMLFLVVYIVLLLAATALAAGCFYAGIAIIMALRGSLGLILGLGLMAVGVSVIFFLIKFVFAVSKNENASRVLITESEQPELFAFIWKLTGETNTQFPKKIYLSDNVNAGVFYNSSFWSMFLPVRKNLEIGLGLVNSLNVSEFKAVMAHEFGHFSQRSMKLGSFTYNVNQVIYNMLYENTSYTQFLSRWGSIHGLLALFAAITVKIAQAIQWILRKMYGVINKSYFELSREMEFHADMVAAGVSGGNNLVTALSRIEVASGCYSTALENAGELLKQNRVSKNIFSNQLSVFQSLAREHNLPVKQQLPEVSYHFMQTFSKSRVNFKDQWASHPTLQERKMMLDRLNIQIDPVETRAWVLFANAERLQEQMTTRLFAAVDTPAQTETYDASYFDQWYGTERDRKALPAAYNGFYDGRYVDATDWDFDTLAATGTTLTFDQLFARENGQLQAAIAANENDVETLQHIRDGQIEVSTFDFDGAKYTVGDCDTVIAQLRAEILVQKEKQLLLDKEAFAWFVQHAAERRGSILDAYRTYRQACNRYNAYIAVADKVFNAIHPFFAGNITLEEGLACVAALKNDHESPLKQLFRNYLAEQLITREAHESLYASIAHFNETSYAYIIGNEIQSAELQQLWDLVVKVAEMLNNQRFASYKQMLHDQITT